MTPMHRVLIGSSTVSGETDEAPEVELYTPFHTDSAAFEDVVVGEGTAITDDSQLIVMDVSITSGETGENLVETNYDGDLSARLAGRAVDAGRSRASRTRCTCATEGSRIVVALPPGGIEAATAASLGLGRGRLRGRRRSTSARCTCRRRTGAIQFNIGSGLPTVVRAPDGRPGIIVPDAEPPTELVVQTLIKGDGEEVTGDAPGARALHRRHLGRTARSSTRRGMPSRRRSTSTRCCRASPRLSTVRPSARRSWSSSRRTRATATRRRVRSRRIRRSCSSSTSSASTSRRCRRRRLTRRSIGSADGPASLDGFERTPRIRVVPANASAKNPPEERLVNLVVALMATEQGLTKDTILSSVSGYREQSEAGASKDALEKMFERDKESLRRLGVPIETIGDWADPDDLREARYRVPTAEYELPEDIVVHPGRARAAEPRRRRVERELDVGRGAQRAAEDPRTRHRRGRADHRLLTAHQPARAVVRRPAAGDRAVARRHLPLSQAGRGRAAHPARAAARARRVRRRAGTSSASTWTSTQSAPSCSRASSATVDDHPRDFRPRAARRRGGAGARGTGGRRRAQLRRCWRSTPAPRPRCGSAGARCPPIRGSTCRSSTSTCSRTNWPRTVRRCASSSPRSCATR